MTSPDSAAERRLAAAIAAGDPDAAQDLCEQYLPHLHTYVRRRSGLDAETSLEVAQETILAALRSAQFFRGESGIHTWLCAIARRKTADHYRRLSRRPLSLDGLTSEGLALIDTGPLPDEVAEREETAAAVHSALWLLPEDQREAVFLKYLDDRSVAEIASELGRSQKAVESLLSRGRSNLRRHLAALAAAGKSKGSRSKGGERK